MSLQTIIFIEILFVLIAITAYLIYYLLNVNSRLNKNNIFLKRKIKNVKSRVKGLRVQVQDLNAKMLLLESELKEKVSENEDLLSKNTGLEEKNHEQLIILEENENKCSEIKLEIKQANSEAQLLKDKIEELESKLDQSQQKLIDRPDANNNYEELYHDLKNAIAYNLSGGEQSISELQNRLIENGNVKESEQVAQLKERYSSIGAMVGFVEDVELFNSKEVKAEDDQAIAQIDNAEDFVNGIQSRLDEANSFQHRDTSDLSYNEDQVRELVDELNRLVEVKDGLESDLDSTSSQLKLFIAKARKFQSQKEQIRMQKETEAQLHRNLKSISEDYRLLMRRYKTIVAQSDVITAQIKRSAKDEQIINKFKDLRSEMERKEEKMDRMTLENEMIEQQFMLMSEEANIELESNKSLLRLQSEHELLEQQFLELLTEYQATKLTDELKFSDESGATDQLNSAEELEPTEE